MNAVAELTPREYYRLPWTLTDNAISWLEVTGLRGLLSSAQEKSQVPGTNCRGTGGIQTTAKKRLHEHRGG
jgi:hypothetical protein